MDKIQLRKIMLAKRSGLNAEQVDTASRLVAGRLINEIDWNGVTRVHIYGSISESNEINTQHLAELLGANWPSMVITVGIPSKNAALPTDKFDVIVVPLLAFTVTGNRLGYGGGWYDKFLAKQPNALKIGVGYEFQLSESIDIEPHDVPLAMVVTDECTYG